MDQLHNQLALATIPERAERSTRYPLRAAPPLGKLSTLLRGAVLATVVIAVAGIVLSRETPPPEPHAPTRLSGGAPTLESLIGRFLQAVQAKDRKALEALRVTEDEYRQLIVPGHVKPGEAPQILSEEASEYYWSVMNIKSLYHREAMLTRMGGKKLELERFDFQKGVQDYAGHRAYKQTEMKLREENGKEVELRTGSIVERDGQFKFTSFIVD